MKSVWSYEGLRVVVSGGGGAGMGAATVGELSNLGAEVHVLALDGSRRSLASSFGATGYWTAEDPPPLTYDAVVDGTDDHRVPAFALARAEPAGRVVFIGVSGAPSLIDSRDLVLGDLTAVGILGASAGLAPAIEHYADGRVDPSGLVDVTVGLSQAAEALAAKVGVPFEGLWLDIPKEVAQARVSARQGDASDATPAVVERQFGYDLGTINWRRQAAER